ncbi:MAG TPA: hypothetical protein PKM88_09485 [bacterium]|nr:hypothetical protein [bacterium]
MAGYWIKLYQEILDDPKMATMSDHLWRRTIELFLVAGKYFDDGNIPDAKQVAWVLRSDEASISADLEAIAATGIITKTENGWIVNKFKLRQSAVSGKDRKAQQRERDHRDQYYGHENVTKCDIDTDIDTDTDTDQKQTQTPPAPEKPDRLTLHDQTYIPMLAQIAALFGEADLQPSHNRIATLQKAIRNVSIGGFPRILEAAQNLARSPAPDGMKRYDWLLHRFDYAEHITEFLTAKNDARPKPRKYAAVPDDWRPDADANTTP